MRKKYLDFYKKYYGRNLPYAGLCSCFENDLAIEVFEPTDDDDQELIRDGYSTTWWGAGIKTEDRDYYEVRYGFTELRQTIVLFMAAMKEDEYA